MQWMQIVENVSEVGKIPFLSVFELNIKDFLDLFTYVVYKNKELEKKYKKK